MARRPLPPLNALRAFEAFGRRGRMTLAADELCVTHGAVSRQVRQLEDHLGVALTEGPRNRLTMTEAGLKLAQGLTRAFDILEEAVPRPREAQPGPTVVSCLPTFAMKWLIPRLPDFLERYPDTPVRVAESNGPFDFRADGIDLAIRMRDPDGPPSPDSDATAFLDTHVGPVAAPALAERASSVEALLTLPRLHTRTFLHGWDQWAARAGVTLPPAGVVREFDHYFYMIEAAAAGLGVAMVPHAFAERDLAAGRLVAPLGMVSEPTLLCALTPRTGASRGARRFRDWLVEQGRACPPPPFSQQP
ncbi:LysR family transcriptional regulator [Caulobacter flavus]|uniref:LysR family transcriptional regulator n=1 Tax=Caulobacter flavus TaxID=1679497 RepID=A0A2N5CZM0_9CAUL|nr:LysR substrate-binding domain-containing protein [Caulobacter flavus]AYV45065.1 LysR family transcriptional regulator [Caulobacter flavus]PLR19253.1 LysR family transcriptional regulator [Caulobacter flavus]